MFVSFYLIIMNITGVVSKKNIVGAVILMERGSVAMEDIADVGRACAGRDT